MVESTEPCAIALPLRFPSSASRHVPSAEPTSFVPQAYDVMPTLSPMRQFIRK